ncbi:MAG: FAD-dependent oxidoreductase [Clostridiales bacterium]|jgi:NAD(P)H-nitrite reductase large subunit|nr:FAD-dependent oxidoreductase [Clostridiales bacterium]
MNYVIIGNSIAAVGGIEGIRRTDGDGNITVVGAEPHHVYSRPLISYLLEGKTDSERIKYRPDDFYKKNKCTLKKGVRAESIDTDKKTVFLDDGEALPFDKLLIATGARPFVPKISGLENHEYHTFMTLGDAYGLEKKLKSTKDAKVLILGAGLIGLKCAEAIYRYAKEITVADMADRVLPSILDTEGSAVIKKHLEYKGIRFLLSTAVELDKMKFDVLCVCTGVIPEANLAKDAGIETGRGIYIDAEAKTSKDGIYAAGDCTEGYSAVTGRRGAIAILPNAYIQGETAGINMAGGNAVYDKAMPMNAIGFFGKHILTAGLYEGEEIKSGSVSGGVFKKLFVKDGKLKGFIFIDDFKRAGLYTALIRDGIDLTGIDDATLLDDIGFKLYPKAERDKVLRNQNEGV